MNVFASQAL